MSLIAFHRFLIVSAIVFCLGFAGWEAKLFLGARDTSALVMAVVFGVLGLGLIGYLWRLNRILGYEEPGGSDAG